jgi:cell division transport system permease protein
MAMSLFVFGAFILLQENLQDLLRGWGDQVQINAYVHKELGGNDVQLMMERIRALPEVEDVRHISQKQAWQDFQTALGAQSPVLEGLPQDVLPASFEIAVKPAYRDALRVQELAGRLRNIDGISSVEYPQEWVDRLSLIVLGVQWAKWILGGILFIATFVIVGSTVRLALLSRKEEIEIMQLVGASEELIQAPFVVEGMLQGFIGAVVSVLGLWLCYFFLREHFFSLPLFGVMTELRFLDLPGIALIVLIGLFLGGMGSLFSLRSFLRRWRG